MGKDLSQKKNLKINFLLLFQMPAIFLGEFILHIALN
jgi:hypothetical protein